MRKQLTVILLSALMLSGCASGRMGNPGAIVGKKVPMLPICRYCA